MKETNNSIIDLINQVNEEVSEGYLDEYWNNHLDMLIELEKIHE